MGKNDEAKRYFEKGYAIDANDKHLLQYYSQFLIDIGENTLGNRLKDRHNSIGDELESFRLSALEKKRTRNRREKSRTLTTFIHPKKKGVNM